MSLYIFTARGAGKSKTVSTSKTRNRTERIKKYRENGERDPFNWSSKPHSIGFILSDVCLVWGGVCPINKINVIIISERVKAVKVISQNISVICRHTFRYAYHVTTYLLFR